MRAGSTWNPVGPAGDRLEGREWGRATCAVPDAKGGFDAFEKALKRTYAAAPSAVHATTSGGLAQVPRRLLRSTITIPCASSRRPSLLCRPDVVVVEILGPLVEELHVEIRSHEVGRD